MASYFKKQVFIGLIYFIIIIAIGGGAYFGFIYSPPSCSDGVLNQDEDDVDCGGVCGECIPELVAPKIVWVDSFYVEENLYDLAAQIENKNINYGAGALPYVFKVYDAGGALILEKRGKSYIMPREKKYIIEVVQLDKNPQKVSLEFDDINWQRFKTGEDFSLIEDLNLPIFNARLDLTKKDNYSARVEGTVYNRTKFDLATIDINVVVYDLNGDPIAVNKTQKNTVKTSEGRFFEVIWPALGISGEQNAKLDLEAHTNVFSDTNFIKTFIE